MENKNNTMSTDKTKSREGQDFQIDVPVVRSLGHVFKMENYKHEIN